MQVFIKQNGYEVIQVKPNTYVTLLANNVPYVQTTFRIYSYPPGQGPPDVVYEKIVGTNWRNEAWIDNVLLNFPVGNYALWAGMPNVPGSDSAVLYFTITSETDPGTTGNWTMILNQVTPEASTYVGKAKRVQFTFSTYPDQLAFINNWLVNNFLNELQTQATANNNSVVLKLKLWRDTSPSMRTDYKGELELTTPPGFETPFLVTAIIVVALAAIAYYFILEPLIGQVIDVIYGPVDPDTGERPDTVLGLSMGTIAIIGIAAAIILNSQRG